jgi:hypothetical protein
MAVMKGCKCNSASSEPCLLCQQPESPEPEDNIEELRLATPEPERCCDNCKTEKVKKDIEILRHEPFEHCEKCENASSWS